MAQVPQELITEALQFFPAKSLLHFRCISKSLRTFIDSSDFIKSHLTATSANRSHRKLVFQGTGHSPIKARYPVPIHVLDIDDHPFPPPVLRQEHPTHEYNFPDNNYFSHCNGLVLLQEKHRLDLVAVWNPSTKKRKIISVSPTESPTDQLPSRVSGFGIGYDSSTDDYKILLIRERKVDVLEYEYAAGYYDYNLQYEIWISGLRSAGYWRKTENPLDFYGCCWFDGSYRNCVVDGAFHFLSWDLRFDVGMLELWALDVATEALSRVSLPMEEFPLKDLELQVVEGCLSVSYFSEMREKMDLYVRKNDRGGGEFYWTKLFRVTNEQLSSLTFGSDISYLGGFSKVGDGEIFIFFDKYVLCSYDFKEKSMKRILLGDKYEQNMIFCIESLVPVDYPIEEVDQSSDQRMKKRRKRAI